MEPNEDKILRDQIAKRMDHERAKRQQAKTCEYRITRSVTLSGLKTWILERKNPNYNDEYLLVAENVDKSILEQAVKWLTFADEQQ